MDHRRNYLLLHLIAIILLMAGFLIGILAHIDIRLNLIFIMILACMLAHGSPKNLDEMKKSKDSRNQFGLSLLGVGLTYFIFGLVLFLISYFLITDFILFSIIWLINQLICSISIIGIGIVSFHYYLSYYFVDEENDALKKNPQELKVRGIEHYRKGQYDQAINLFKEALSVDPKNSAIWCDLGAAYNKKKDYPQAIDACKRSILEEEEEDPYVRNHLGLAYYHTHEYDEAIKALKVALELDPNYEQAAYNLAKVYSKMKRYEDAIDMIKLCLKINPKFEKAERLMNEIQKNSEKTIQ